MANDNDIYGECRLFGHAWHPVPSDWTPEIGSPITVRCERCDMERRDTCTRDTGELMSRRYTYPVGYRIPRAETPTRSEFRLWFISAHTTKRRKAKTS